MRSIDAAERLRKESAAKDQALQTYMKQHELGTSLDVTTNTIKAHLIAIDAARTSARLEVLQRQNEFNQVEAYQREGRNWERYAWIKAPNQAFDGGSALAVMLKGELTDLMRVRRYLDAARGGW